MRGSVSNGTKQSSLPSPGSRSRKLNWYLAELVQECRVENYTTSHVWVNTHLIRAGSNREAYEKAQKIGKAYNSTYKNDAGGKVTWRFRGLRELLPILASIEDGAELAFESHTRLTPKGVRAMVKAKAQLAAFRDA
ncbi:MAG: DUF4288 domain-containing protein [Verrucomicrobia bacterium]|nr:DUF4288 domain-containing protein [Verrucomicrobiota bacterium]